jgi:predicted metal-dependent hydrolase
MNLQYEVIRSARKSIGITVERDRRVIVRAPHEASDQSVSAAVASKRFWIWQKLRDPNKYPDPLPAKEFVTGETLLFLGQPYTLVFVEGKSGTVKLVGEQFEVGFADQDRSKELFKAWYLGEARACLGPRIATLAAEMGIGYRRICVRELRYRWASCTPAGTLSFNWRIVQAPMIVVDYLIVHELAHVREPNHSPEFWNLVAVHAPNWSAARGWLKQNGSGLEW